MMIHLHRYLTDIQVYLIKYEKENNTTIKYQFQNTYDILKVCLIV